VCSILAEILFLVIMFNLGKWSINLLEFAYHK
jgi:hypothetical protein